VSLFAALPKVGDSAPLFSGRDQDDKIIAAYDAKMPVVSLSKRVSFLIGLDGKIVHVTDAMNPQTHFDEMQAAIAGLKKP
jgi:peroxiredoxin